MENLELKVKLTKKEREALLIQLTKILKIRKYEIDNWKSEFTNLVLPFKGSLEGLNIFIENNNMLSTYTGKSTLVEEGLIQKGWHWVIMPWVYEDMLKKELNRMKAMINQLLKLLPKAVLIFDGDGSVDYNPNSEIPEHPKNYTIKVTKEKEWEDKFDF